MARRMEGFLITVSFPFILDDLLIFIHTISAQSRHLLVCKAVGPVKDGFNAKTQNIFSRPIHAKIMMTKIEMRTAELPSFTKKRFFHSS